MKKQDFLIEFHWETGSEKNIDLKGHTERIDDEIKLRGTYGFMDDERLEVDGYLQFETECSCDLCLKKFRRLFEIPFSEMYYPSGSEEGFNYQGNKLDLSPLVADMVAMALEEKQLCQESCKGLCEICGEDLNKGDCGCEKRTINPKFQKLEQLLKD